MYLRRCGILFLGMLSSSRLYSQNKAPDAANLPTFQSKVRVVLVDVVVINGKDEPVSSIVKDDFAILEDGQPQKISFFEEHKAPSSAPIKLPPMPPHVYTNFPATQSADVVNVLLLDWLNTHPRDQAYVHAEVIKYLKDSPAGSRLAVFILGENLRMVHGVTTDAAALVSALENKKEETGPMVSRLSSTQENTSGLIAPTPDMSPEAIAMRQSAANENNAFIRGSRAAATIEGLQQLARYLAAIPGRKNLLWFSGSFPVTLFPATDTKTYHPMSPYQKELQQTSDLLTPGQVAIYPIAAQGLTGLPQYEAGNSGRLSPGEDQRIGLERAGNQIAMEELARDTGGKAYYNTNGLKSAIARAINDGVRYYTLAYSPTNKKMDGKFRNIRIKLLGDNYKLSYRQGYYADAIPQSGLPRSASDPLASLMIHGFPQSSQVVYKVDVAPSSQQPAKNAAIAGENSKLKRSLTRYNVDFAVSLPDIKLETTPDGVRHGNIEAALMACDHGGTPVNWVVQKYDVALDPKMYAAMERTGLQLHLQIDVPPGDIYLSTGIYDSGSSKAGTLEIPLTVAEPPQIN